VNITKINSRNAEFQIIYSLKTNRVKRNKLKEIFIEGIECVKQAADSNAEITRIIIRDKNNLSNWGKEIIAANKNAKIISMPEELYCELTDKIIPPEMLVTVKMKNYKISDINAENPFIIVFDRPGDLGNLGSIIRSANAFNADGILIIGHGADFYEPKAIRASLGGIFFTKIVLMESAEQLTDYIKFLKEKNNLEVIGTDSKGPVLLGEYKIKKPLMLVIGNEAKGMSVKLKEICDKIIGIPAAGNVNSLNVSCAASIMMWEVYKNS